MGRVGIIVQTGGKIGMEEVLRDILSWYEKKSSPNEYYAYSRCPICNATWWGDEIHNLQCWIPLLKHKLYLLE